MGNLISKIQSISGVLSIFLLIVVIAFGMCGQSFFGSKPTESKIPRIYERKRWTVS